jgi:RNA polymerase sigma-70 factor (sigma-E family)
MREPVGFQEYVRGQQAFLLRSAYLITSDAETAHDLVQGALVRLWPRWERVSRMENVNAYVHRTLVTTYLGWRRRRWWGESPHGELPVEPLTADPQEAATDRVALAEVLRRLPARQRTVIVLRFYADLTEAQTATAMGCSVGTVKSQTAKALVRLRQLEPLAAHEPTTKREQP